MKGEELKRKRKELGLTQQGLANILGVTRNTVARWERDEMAMPSFLGLALEGLENRLGNYYTTQVTFGEMADAVIKEVEKELSVKFYWASSYDAFGNYDKREFFYDAYYPPTVKIWRQNEYSKPSKISVRDDFGKLKSRRVLKEKLTSKLNEYLESDE